MRYQACRSMAMLVWGVLAFVLACGNAPKLDPVGEQPVEVAKDVVPQLLELRIWPGVDTADAFNAEALACLRRFCAKKFDREAENDYWDPADLSRFGAFDEELRYADFDSVGEPRYGPTLLHIRPTEMAEERMLTVRWARTDSAGVAYDVRYVFDFLARRTGDGVRLALPIDHRSRDWETRQVGMVRYIISPQHVFSIEQAEEQRADIERLSDFFGVAQFPFTYYSCSDPTDLFRLKGYQQHPLMHVFPTGGRGEGGIVYSGNDKDIYTHEVVHLFCRHAFNDNTPGLLEEGLATLLAGSADHDYAWHRANLARWLAADSTIDLNDHTNTYQRFYINEHTDVPYAVGALLCERVLVSAGKEALFALLRGGEDPWPALERHGITRKNLTEELRKQLSAQPTEKFL
ncbi:MAG: hypothetical protein JNL43_11615 [Flavobacteriales bacterium]|nr:hypothetical protein [Flavobacteriales bacterium]